MISLRARPACFVSFLLLYCCGPAVRAQWTQPTAEELKMTAQPEVPGAAAVYLYREETTDDEMHNSSTYVRLKVLTERGKEYGTIELPYEAGGGARIQVTEIAGRTIHPDGTVVPFTGKPFEKLVQKTTDAKFMAKVFSLPDIEVGSILEYRYRVRYEDNYFISPRWMIQSNLFTRKAHYRWDPTTRELTSSDERGTVSNSLAWLPILPPGDSVKATRVPRIGNTPEHQIMTLDIQNVPPMPQDEYMPPMAHATYRVLFYYTPYRTVEEYWGEQGKHWAKVADKFIGPGPAVRSAATEYVAASDAPLDKLKKLYAAVMKLENTDLTRQHSVAEERTNGLREVKNTDDVLLRKRGSGDELTELFVALARAAGFKAYLAIVTSRDTHFFLKPFLSFQQFDDDLAVVNVDGKDLFFDPGERYMPFQHLAWKHTFASGIREADKGVTFVDTPGEPYGASHVQRIASLDLSDNGEANGTIRMIYTGVAALRWRQAALRGDVTSVDRELVESCEELLGKGLDVKVSSIDKMTDYEQPLTVVFSVKGPIASSAGHRLVISSDLFEAQQSPTFTGATRTYPIFFHYPYFTQDVVQIRFPAGLALESLPKTTKEQFQKSAAYSFRTEQTPRSYTIRRDLVLGDIAFPLADWEGLKTFYRNFETQDRESVVLKPVTVASANLGN